MTSCSKVGPAVGWGRPRDLPPLVVREPQQMFVSSGNFMLLLLPNEPVNWGLGPEAQLLSWTHRGS